MEHLKIRLSIVPLIFLLICPLFSKGLNHAITVEKRSLMILPANKDHYPIIGEKIIATISNQATSIGRFHVIDRTIIDEVLNEQKLQMSGLVSDDKIITLGKMATAEEALILDVIHFGQKGIPKPKKIKKNDNENDNTETLFSWVVKKSVIAIIDNSNSEKEKRKLELENNINTVITATIRLIDIETGISKESFKIESNYTGGNKNISLKKALENLSFQINQHLKELYTITSEIIDVNNNTISILCGKNLGLNIGDYFEIASKDKQKLYKGTTYTLPGKKRGLVKITDVGPNASKAQIIRKWRKIKKGHRAYEILNNIFVSDFKIAYSQQSPFHLNSGLLLKPFSKFYSSVNGHIGLLNNSRNNLNLYFGINPSLNYNIISWFGSKIDFTFDLPISLATATDDANNFVKSGLIMPTLGCNFGIQINKELDIIFSLDYILGNNQSNWTYTENTGKKDSDGNDKIKSQPAIWHDEAPSIDAKGSRLGITFRYYWLK